MATYTMAKRSTAL